MDNERDQEKAHAMQLATRPRANKRPQAVGLAARDANVDVSCHALWTPTWRSISYSQWCPLLQLLFLILSCYYYIVRHLLLEAMHLLLVAYCV